MEVARQWNCAEVVAAVAPNWRAELRAELRQRLRGFYRNSVAISSASSVFASATFAITAERSIPPSSSTAIIAEITPSHAAK